MSTRRQSLLPAISCFGRPACITTVHKLRLDSIKSCEAHTKGWRCSCNKKLTSSANECRRNQLAIANDRGPEHRKALTQRANHGGCMQGKQPAYFTARSLRLTRDAQGMLVVEFHSNGGPLTFTASDHTDFVDAFYRISQDRENKIVILTGTGGKLTRESTSLHSAMLAIPQFGVRSTTKASRSSRIWQTSAFR